MSLDDQASELLRAAGHADLCNIELLRTEAIKRDIFDLKPAEGSASLRKPPTTARLYQPKLTPPKAIRPGTALASCAKCGRPRSKASSGSGVCRTCYNEKTQESFKNKLIRKRRQREEFFDLHSYVAETISLSMVFAERYSEDFSHAIVQRLSEAEEDAGAPITDWRKLFGNRHLLMFDAVEAVATWERDYTPADLSSG